MEKNIAPRQGDLLFVPTTLRHWDKPEIKNLKKNGVIREGEATGHHHRLEDPDMADVYLPQWGEPVINVKGNGATVVHPEHKPVRLKPNTTYKVHVAREFDITDGTRYVSD